MKFSFSLLFYFYFCSSSLVAGEKHGVVRVDETLILLHGLAYPRHMHGNTGQIKVHEVMITRSAPWLGQGEKS